MGVIPKQTPIAEDAEDVDIERKAGQVILLDFWATWCPPCQGPMAHNQEMLEKNKEKWGDKVRIIGLSIDQDVQKLRDHVKAKGWTSVEHYHTRNGKNSADKDYGVQGVPHCLLVDTHGKIVFVGHPASRKLEEDINTLLEDEKITGAGTTKAGGEDEGQGEGAAKDIKDEDYERLTTLFKDGTKGICQDQAITEQAKKLQRAFFVLVVDAKIDPATCGMKGSLICITQLFGDKDAAEII